MLQMSVLFFVCVYVCVFASVPSLPPRSNGESILLSNELYVFVCCFLATLSNERKTQKTKEKNYTLQEKRNQRCVSLANLFASMPLFTSMCLHVVGFLLLLGVLFPLQLLLMLLPLGRRINWQSKLEFPFVLVGQRYKDRIGQTTQSLGVR